MNVNHSEAIRLLEALLQGVDPFTGEILDADIRLFHPQVIRSLYHAIQLIQDESKSKPNKKNTNLPINNGNKWNEDLKLQLKSLFMDKDEIQEIASILGRTEGSITGQLSKMGILIRTENGYIKAPEYVNYGPEIKLRRQTVGEPPDIPTDDSAFDLIPVEADE